MPMQQALFMRPGSSFTYPSFAGTLTVQSNTGGGVGAKGTCTFNTDGTITYAGVTTINSNTAGTDWATPTTAGVGSTHWIRVNRSGSNTYTGPTLNTWVALSSAQAPALDGGAAIYASKSENLTIDISTDSGGSTIVSTYVIQITMIKLS